MMYNPKLLKMKKYIIIGLIIIFNSYNILAQNDLDAIKFSQTFEGGTARSLSMGGAFSSLGMDLSTLATNPAGLAISRHSYLVFSPQLGYTSVQGDLLGEKHSDDRYNYKLNNFGVSKSFMNDGIDNGWRGISFGLSYNKIKNFNSSSIVKGINNESSMLDNFMLNSDGILPNNLGTREYYAYNAYLTDYDTISLLYNHPLYQNYGETQKRVLDRVGNIGEYSFSLAANYADIVYLGFTFGIQNVYFKEVSTYTESDDAGIQPDFSSFTMREHLSTSGSGYNVKMGIIVRPIDQLRLSFAFHTPTVFDLNDTYYLTMESQFKTPDADGNYGYFLDETFDDDIVSNYQLTTPATLLAGASFIFPGVGLISADYEYKNFSKMKFKASDYDYSDLNDFINSEYKYAHTGRIGIEIIAIPGIALRAGAVYSTPISKNISSYAYERMAFSAGGGFNADNFFLDIGGIYNMYKWQQYSYTLPSDWSVAPPLEKYSVGDLSIVATVGFKF